MSQAEPIGKDEALPAPVIEVRTVPAIPPPVPHDPKLKREYRAFLQMLPQLLKTHYEQYVAIHEGKVVESGSDLVAVALRAYARHGMVPIYVELVTDRPQPLVRIPSPRSVGSKTSPWFAALTSLNQRRKRILTIHFTLGLQPPLEFLTLPSSHR
jgi:hypothetical protein